MKAGRIRIRINKIWILQGQSLDYRFFMPEIQHPEYISAAARALEAAAVSCYGAEHGSSALLMDADGC